MSGFDARQVLMNFLFNADLHTSGASLRLFWFCWFVFTCWFSMVRSSGLSLSEEIFLSVKPDSNVSRSWFEIIISNGFSWKGGGGPSIDWFHARAPRPARPEGML